MHSKVSKTCGGAQGCRAEAGQQSPEACMYNKLPILHRSFLYCCPFKYGERKEENSNEADNKRVVS